MRYILISLLFIHFNSLAQERASTYVDNQGVIRWSNSEEEVKGFGINYTVPFAHAYRTAEKLGINQKEAIEKDIYHFKRLGFNLYRIHVWDTEISDTLGNLINNEHLDHFDYLLHKLKQNNINYVITPIAFWGNGWPEPDQHTPGFSNKYGKGECLTDPKCITAQQNYLTQFMNHVNSYNGISYKDDPNLIAIEVSNEPHHRGEAQEVTKFVKGMVQAIKKSGCEKPIFYNMSHAVHFANNYLDGSIDGGTFQWYPTGLGYGKELTGNLLPNVNDYKIPFDSSFKSYGAAKLVYEFDAADVGQSYIYPAMARSFRSAGIQIATHFAYDPTFMSRYNTEYNTHYMNLAYTPSKALGLMIAAKVFEEVPMYKSFGSYPDNKTFQNFQVNYQNDLAVYNSKNAFIYTNDNNILPKSMKSLNEIAGFGNSPIIEYKGKGAYFLDKLDKNSWRLELMPDAVWVNNPFGRNSLSKTIGVINSVKHDLKIILPNLGEDYFVQGINKNNTYQTQAKEGVIQISPGTYILSSAKDTKIQTDTPFNGGYIGSFITPKDNVDKAYFSHKPYEEVIIGDSLKVEVQYIAPDKPDSIYVSYFKGWRPQAITLTETTPYIYKGYIPVELDHAGFLNYYVIATQSGKHISYPAQKEGLPFQWDFYERATYTVKVVPKHFPLHLFNAKDDTNDLVRQWRKGFQLVPTTEENEYEAQMYIEKLFGKDEENLYADPIYDYTFKHFIKDNINSREGNLTHFTRINIKARSLTNTPLKLQVALVMDNGMSFGGMVEISDKTDIYSIELSSLKPVKTVTLPRPYPSFLPYYFDHELSDSFDINRVESIQFSIGPGLNDKEQKQAHGLGLIAVDLK